MNPKTFKTLVYFKLQIVTSELHYYDSFELNELYHRVQESIITLVTIKLAQLQAMSLVRIANCVAVII